LNHLTVPIAIVCDIPVSCTAQQRAVLVDNRPFGRLEGTRLDGTQQAKPKCDCVTSWHRKASTCQSQL
jgi:hypothetical protein